jgi:hypothetical protein
MYNHPFRFRQVPSDPAADPIVHPAAPCTQAEWIESGKQWLRPSSRILSPAGSPGASAEFVLQLSIATDIRSKDAALERAGTTCHGTTCHGTTHYGTACYT